MTFAVERYLYCDGPGLGADCPYKDSRFASVTTDAQDTITEQRKAARRAGWMVGINGRDYCPECREQLKR